MTEETFYVMAYPGNVLDDVLYIPSLVEELCTSVNTHVFFRKKVIIGVVVE